MTMTLAEALSEGLKTTVVGVTIVFSVLLILMFVMMLMKVIFYKPEKTAKAPKNNAPVAEPAKAEVTADASIDETELVAVLTAAIAACLNTSTYNLNIKSYRRINDHSPAWNKAGRRDVIDSRF